MVTPADRLTPTFQRARQKIYDSFFADSYEIVRMEQIKDNRGGSTSTPQVVESGRCSLTATNLSGSEDVRAGRMLATVSYQLELPFDTVLRDTDTIVINGDRKFAVSNVKREGNWGISTTADLEEKG